MIRKIITFDEALLRSRCLAVRQVDDGIRRTLDDMRETLYAAPNAGGLAANQIGVFRRLVVLDMGEGYFELVNPELVASSGEQLVGEGCLSFPGVWAQVRRPAWVKVRALDRNGGEIFVEGRGGMAKCLCHELDHLDGKLFLDVAERVSRR